MKKLYIKTFGCQMNVYDSKRMEDTLAVHGYESIDMPDEADLVILNTCHIREKAAEKVYSDLGRLNILKKKQLNTTGKEMSLAVAGCVAQAEGAEIVRRAPYVDMVFGPQTYHRLPEMIARLERQKNGGKPTAIVDTEFPIESKFDFLPEESKSQGVTAFLSIQEGCDKFCTYCVVPYTRGMEVSRPPAAVMAEAKQLIKAGAKEINVLGQNVNAYHGPGPDGKDWSLGRLLFALAELEGLARIRYTTSHPRDMHDDLYKAHAEIDILMPYLHLPAQAGSDRVLKEMNRQYTVAEYLAVIDRLRGARDDLVFSSDFIVGFPGESEKDFQETLKLVEQVNYAQAYSFKYSPRPGTPASTSELQIPEEVKAERLAQLQDLVNTQQKAFNQTFKGRTIPVLFERAGKKEGQLRGRSPWMQSVVVQGNARLINEIVDVDVIAGYANSLRAEMSVTEVASVRRITPPDLLQREGDEKAPDERKIGIG